MKDATASLDHRDHRILLISRILGYSFAFMLVFIIAMAMIPNQFFIVSTRAVVNAPVQMIASPIYGRVDKIALQVGQVVNLGDVMATVSNPNQDQTSLTGLRLEKLDLAEKLNNTTSVVAERNEQLEKVKAQIASVKDGVLSELSAVIDNAKSNVQTYEARLSEQDALLQRQLVLLKRGLVSDASIEPQRQKRNAAQYELDAARGELRRNEIVQSLVSRDIYTGGTVAANLLTLEMQRSKLSGDIAEDTIEINQMAERKQQVENLIGREEGRLGKTGAAEVVAERHGQIVSVDASFGDFVMQGQPVAKSLDCNDAFAAAVYRSRDVTSLEIGMPAMVNFRSLGVKRSAHIYKIVRYFNSGPENRYFAKFPEAEGHEVYVLVKMDEPAADEATTAQRSNDKFFGCHVGEDVIVSLGETMISRVARYSSLAINTIFSSGNILSASTLFDKTVRPRAASAQTAAP
ncbi:MULTISPECIES: HlyD family efflux transporter periplasmic adaptor subunit [unclassified Rhizobium]|uniref:HlyD family secretion protein n=1 Tax=unclassified Rhizobium TaxID=2613769 RepID=UPI00161A15DC|nr:MULTISPECIES: HlyD family efflux transporter periplasmic adaptor subunit [unclassified Rhizobium]MBB3540367.1 multidrug resistance efflux pump [Rhizobium sp. BK399]MCS3738622.1 multidrug resistance efflux pump [Rhizobium sp. BK661]